MTFEQEVWEGMRVHTPRFLDVTIRRVYSDPAEARRDGFREPTHFDGNPWYNILGRNIGENMMDFAAVRNDRVFCLEHYDEYIQDGPAYTYRYEWEASEAFDRTRNVWNRTVFSERRVRPDGS